MSKDTQQPYSAPDVRDLGRVADMTAQTFFGSSGLSSGDPTIDKALRDLRLGQP